MLSTSRTRAALTLSVTLFLSLALPARTLFAWGRDGHQIVAQIAEARLTPKAKAGVAELLGTKSLSDVASWADEIRKDRDETSTWHYVDIPYEMKGYDAARDGKNGANVIDKLRDFAEVLNDRNAKKDERTEALKFVVHFTGDLHQPLHCADRNDDKGGNFCKVWFPGEKKLSNLHRIWDSSIIDRIMDREKLKTSEYADALNAKITKDMERDFLSDGDPVHWANEAHQIAVAVSYKDMPSNRDLPPPKIGDAYFITAEPAVELQLQRAGVRLAALLNRIFG